MVSYSAFGINIRNLVNVLILVVMEDGLVLADYKFTKLDYMCVLILVVMEDGLVLRWVFYT